MKKRSMNFDTGLLRLFPLQMTPVNGRVRVILIITRDAINLFIGDGSLSQLIRESIRQ